MPFKDPLKRAAYLKAYKRKYKSDQAYYLKHRERVKENVVAYQKRNPDKLRVWNRKQALRKRYGITPGQYDALFLAQQGHCALCPSVPKTRRLHVDHDHKTSKVRGLLCYRCNNFLVAGNTVESARRVLAYLEQHA
jgi:hypothetical protein